MAPQPCPACHQSEGRWLEWVSEQAYVDYFRCFCGHVWTVSKDAGHERRNITEMRGAAATAEAPATRLGAHAG
jgi:hypothetical protein